MFDSKTKTFVVAVAVVTAMILLNAGCFLTPVMAQEGNQAAGITACKIVETNEYDRWEKKLAKAKEQYEKSYRMFLAIPTEGPKKYRAYLKVKRDYTTYKELEKKYNEWIAKKGSTLDGIVYEAIKGKKRPRGVAKATVSIYHPIMIMRKNVEKADISIAEPPIRKPLYTAVTSKKGKYKLSKMKPGRYMMTIEKEGYEEYTLFNLDLKSGRNKAKDYIKKGPVQVATSLSGIVRRAPGFPGYEELQEDVDGGRESIPKPAKKKTNILQPLQGADVVLTISRPLMQDPLQWEPVRLGGLCIRCKDRMYTADIGACSIPDCRGMTSSGGFQLCKSCSARLGQCMACRGALVPLIKSRVISAKTDAEGAFNFPRLFDGKVHLLVTCKGFLPYEETFNIKKGGSYTRNTIILYPVFRDGSDDDLPVPLCQEKSVEGQDVQPADSIEDAFDQ